MNSGMVRAARSDGEDQSDRASGKLRKGRRAKPRYRNSHRQVMGGNAMVIRLRARGRPQMALWGELEQRTGSEQIEVHAVGDGRGAPRVALGALATQPDLARGALGHDR